MPTGIATTAVRITACALATTWWLGGCTGTTALSTSATQPNDKSAVVICRGGMASRIQRPDRHRWCRPAARGELFLRSSGRARQRY